MSMSSPEAWRNVRGKYKVGQTVSATVTRHLPYGLGLSFGEDVFAVVDNLSIWNDQTERHSKGMPPVGAEVRAVIVDFVDEIMEIKLSLRVRDFPPGAAGGG